MAKLGWIGAALIGALVGVPITAANSDSLKDAAVQAASCPLCLSSQKVAELQYGGLINVYGLDIRPTPNSGQVTVMRPTVKMELNSNSEICDNEGRCAGLENVNLIYKIFKGKNFQIGSVSVLENGSIVIFESARAMFPNSYARCRSDFSNAPECLATSDLIYAGRFEIWQLGIVYSKDTPWWCPPNDFKARNLPPVKTPYSYKKESDKVHLVAWAYQVRADGSASPLSYSDFSLADHLRNLGIIIPQP